MKKIFISILTLTCISIANAQDEVQVVPATISAGTANTLSINLNNPSFDNKLQTITIDIVWPTGWTIGKPSLNQERVATYDPDFEEYGDNNFAMGSNVITEETGETATRYLMYSTNKTPLNGTTGTIFTIKVKAPAGTADGIYPIKIVGTHYMTMDADASHNIDLGESTSYIVVGTPTDATLSVQGVLPSFVTTAACAETAITALDLSAATQINGTLTLDDKGITAVGDNVTAEKVSYTRTADEGIWGTYCLPFEVPAVGASKITSCTSDKIYVNAIEEETIAAATPFLKKGGIDVSVDNVTLAAAPAEATNNILGVYTQTKVTDANTYYLYQNAFYGISEYFNVAPYHAYITGVAGGARLAIEDTPTGINTLNADETESIYSITGSKLNKVQKGVNIVNGNKVLVK